MVTIKEIALRAGVAKSTVSNVLTGKKYVSPEITERVKKICAELDYQPNFYATALSAKARTNIIGLFLENTIDGQFRQFYSDLIESCISNLSRDGKNLLVYSGLNSKETLIKLTNGKSPIDGAIILSPTFNDERILNMSTNMKPMVAIGRVYDYDSISTVDINNRSLTRVIASTMVRRGYDSICLLNSSERLTISKEREEGFSEALRDKHVSFITKNIESIADDGYELALSSINKGTNAFITASEIVASGVYKACKELNKRIPEDVCVFSLGCNPGNDKLFTPRLSHAYQDYKVIGEKACEILEKIISGEKQAIHIMIDSEIHSQDSFKFKEK